MPGRGSFGRRIRLGRRQRQRGAALVEAGLVLGPVLLVLYGLIEFTLIFIMTNAVQFAAGRAAALVAEAPMRGNGVTLETLRTDLQSSLTLGGVCITLDVFEYPNLDELALDYTESTGLLPGYQQVRNNAALTVGAYPLETGESFGQGSRTVALIHVTCRWAFASQLFAAYYGEAIDLRARAVIRYRTSISDAP